MESCSRKFRVAVNNFSPVLKLPYRRENWENDHSTKWIYFCQTSKTNDVFEWKLVTIADVSSRAANHCQIHRKHQPVHISAQPSHAVTVVSGNGGILKHITTYRTCVLSRSCSAPPQRLLGVSRNKIFSRGNRHDCAWQVLCFEVKT